jgi:hypothetical protein
MPKHLNPESLPIGFQGEGHMGEVLEQIVYGIIRKHGMVNTGGIGRVASYHVTGDNPALAIPGLTGPNPNPLKTYKVMTPIGLYGANALQANDYIYYHRDWDDNLICAGKWGNANEAIIDAQAWGTMQWVKPGADNVAVSLPTERDSQSAAYEVVKSFNLSRPGQYRIAGKLSRSAGSASLRASRLRSDGSKQVLTTDATYSGSVHPAFDDFTLDFLVAVPPDAIIQIELLNTSGAGFFSYVKEVEARYSPATAPPALWDAVILD